MSGVAVVRFLLATNAPLISALGIGPPIATRRIMAGDLPLNAVLPAIGVKQISSMPRNTVKMNEARVQHTDRVQVSVLVKDTQATPAGDGYPGMRSLLKMVLAACPNMRGIVNQIDVDSILPDIEGPDLPGDADGSMQGSRDLIVRWNSP